MLLSDRPRALYRNAPAHEVICQLRFPAILSINQVEPAEFQESIRETFPQYARRQDLPAVPKGQVPQPVTNYHFLSEDGRWKLNLTKDFIALSTLRYPGWEEFARHLDQPLASFIRLYKPAYFQRVGLRYVNILSRSRLGLEDFDWAELIAPAYTAPIRESGLAEENFLSCACDLTVKLDSSCQAKIHAGPGRIKAQAPGVPQDPEVKYILDMDLSMGGNVPCTLSAGGLETLHGHATRIFEGALTDALRQAMDPV